jgi:sugar fermentation stimulation protein A
MKYKNVTGGVFVSRPNRFIAIVDVKGEDGEVKRETVHVKNTGRCKELLVPGCKVFLEISDNPQRKTKYDVIGVYKEQGEGKPTLIINMDSQAPNRAVESWLKKGADGLFGSISEVKREVTFGDSRLDFCITDNEGKKTFIEVKGVTLEREGIAMFPDAPTERGIKHLRELERCVKEGQRGCVLFVIQMKGVKEMQPNDDTHKAFGDALRSVVKNGVRVLSMDCVITETETVIDKPVKVVL